MRAREKTGKRDEEKRHIIFCEKLWIGGDRLGNLADGGSMRGRVVRTWPEHALRPTFAVFRVSSASPCLEPRKSQKVCSHPA